MSTAPNSESSAPKPAAERAAAIRSLQENALSRLPTNTLYIGLWIRSDPPPANDFHWAFYLHTASQSGIKYHITNTGDVWTVSHAPESGITKSLFLCVLIKLASVPADKHRQLDSIMRSYDADLRSIPGVTCRVWLLRVLQKLIESGLVQCSVNVDALETECKEFGNEYRAGATMNEQPRPVVCSRLCL